MKVKTNIKSGGIKLNHNEKAMDADNGSIEKGKGLIKKLSLKKETVRELKGADLKAIAGGKYIPITNSVCMTFCCND